MSEASYLGLIPARAGSKGIPRKNLVDLGGRPLLQWTLEAALGSSRLHSVLLSSDDAEMIELASALGVAAPFKRPDWLSGDEAKTIDVVLHALDWVERVEEWTPTAVVLLQPTSPFRTAADVDAAINVFEESGRDSLCSVTEVLQHPCEMVVRDTESRLRRVLEPVGHARQSFPPCWFIDGAIYITSTRMLREQQKFCDEQSATYELPPARAVDIDTEFQLAIARGLVSSAGTH